MLLDNDEHIIEHTKYVAAQERQIDRTVRQLMAAYRLSKEGKIHSSVVSARYSLHFFSDITCSMLTYFSFQVNLAAESHGPGCVWDFTDETKTRACVEHYLRKEIDDTYKKFGTLGYLSLKFVY